MTGQSQSQAEREPPVLPPKDVSTMYQKELCWCVCYLAHKVPGWCFCSLDQGKREAFTFRERDLLLAEQWGNETEDDDDDQPRRRDAAVDEWGQLRKNTLMALPRLSPKTPDLKEQRIERKTEIFSSMLKEEPSSADVIELGGGGLEPYAKRKLEEDFVKAIENNNNDDDGGDEEEKKKSPKRKRRKRRKKAPPWHSWLCMGCGKKLPDGHMNCVGEILRQFDHSMKYGPCIGITRMERWLRASQLGLNPPENVMEALYHSQNLEIINACLWEGRIPS